MYEHQLRGMAAALTVMLPAEVACRSRPSEVWKAALLNLLLTLLNLLFTLDVSEGLLHLAACIVSS